MTAFAGTWSLVRLVLRRDRIRLPVWVLAIVGLIYFSVDAVQGIYDTQQDIDAYARTVGGSPAAIVMSGPVVGLHTLGGVTVYEVNLTAIVATALMAIFLTTRHTRAEEEAGRTELLRAGVVGPAAALAAPLLVVSAASVLVGLGVTLTFLGAGLPATGSWLYGAATAMTGLVFMAVSAVAVQVTEHSRGALGLAGAVLALAWVLRAAGDVAENFLTWLSPVGWAQGVHAFGGDRWWPLAVCAVFVVAGLWSAQALARHRDIGAGLVAARPGRADASPRLSGVVAMATRLQRGSLVGWVVGMFLGGLAYGSVGREVEDMVRENPDLKDLLAATGSTGDLVDSFLGTAIMVLALVSTGFTIASVLRMRGEESAGRAEPVLATDVSRVRWYSGWLTVTLAGTVLVLGATGVGVGLGHSIGMADPGQLPRLLLATMSYLPAVLVLGAVAALLFGWLPRASYAAWAVLAGSVVVGWLGALLDIPDRVADLSPFAHTPAVPGVAYAVTPLVVLALIAAGMTVVGGVGLRRRDIG